MSSSSGLISLLLDSRNRISFNGVPGVGKSTLCRSFELFLPSDLVKVYVEKGHLGGTLETHLADVHGTAEAFQMWMLAQACVTTELMELTSADKKKGLWVIDRDSIGNAIFALMMSQIEGHISPSAFSLYCSAYRSKVHASGLDYSFFLHAPINVCIERVKERGHAGEIEKYQKSYFKHLMAMSLVAICSQLTNPSTAAKTFVLDWSATHTVPAKSIDAFVAILFDIKKRTFSLGRYVDLHLYRSSSFSEDKKDLDIIYDFSVCDSELEVFLLAFQTGLLEQLVYKPQDEDERGVTPSKKIGVIFPECIRSSPFNGPFMLHLE